MIIQTQCPQEIRAAIKANRETPHYVYVLIRPDTGQPFYVGKGKGYRVFNHEKELDFVAVVNPYKVNVIRKILSQGQSLVYAIDSFHLFEADALQRECALIAEIGRSQISSGTLTNLTDGGEGIVGWIDFEQHSRSGRPDKDHAGQIDALMERPEGIAELELIAYLNKYTIELHRRRYRQRVNKKKIEEFLAEYLPDYLFGKYRDDVLGGLSLLEERDGVLFRREDELSALIKALFRSNGPMSEDEITTAIDSQICSFKKLPPNEITRIACYFLDELSSKGKVYEASNGWQWKEKIQPFKFEIETMQPSQIVSEIENYSRRRKNLYIAFTNKQDSLASDLILFPHHFRKGLKIYFKQTIALLVNTSRACTCQVHPL